MVVKERDDCLDLQVIVLKGYGGKKWEG